MARVIGNFFRAVRVFAPWIFRTLWDTLRLIALTVSKLWLTVPNALDLIANKWLERADKAEFPKGWDTPLYYILWVVALATILLGWIFLSFATVWLVNRLLL